jgi:hypothetical protein
MVSSEGDSDSLNQARQNNKTSRGIPLRNKKWLVPPLTILPTMNGTIEPQKRTKRDHHHHNIFLDFFSFYNPVFRVFSSRIVNPPPQKNKTLIGMMIFF